MNVTEALKQRHAVRAYLNQEVEQEKIKAVLDAARHAPSGVNIQPWHVSVLKGAAKKNLCQRMEQSFREGNKGKMDYDYYPNNWIEPYKSRRKECGLLMYSTLKISREDKQRQLDQWAANYRAFDAPLMLLFFIDPELSKGSYLDYGMFLQSVMLAATEQGLATCPQAALAEYPKIVLDELNYDKDLKLVCGMALGYEDTKATINSYRVPRIETDEFTDYFE